jgi:hypothetical protein
LGQSRIGVCGLRAYVFQIFFGLPQWFIEAFGANKLLKGLQLIRPKIQILANRREESIDARNCRLRKGKGEAVFGL